MIYRLLYLLLKVRFGVDIVDVYKKLETGFEA